MDFLVNVMGICGKGFMKGWKPICLAFHFFGFGVCLFFFFKEYYYDHYVEKTIEQGSSSQALLTFDWVNFCCVGRVYALYGV